jgi:hypothetical protein
MCIVGAFDHVRGCVGMVSCVPSNRREPSRRRRPSPRPWRTVVAVFAVVLAAVGAWHGWQYVLAHRVTITFVDVPPTGVELSFFPDQLAFAAPSPPPPLGRLTLDAAAVTVGSELVPDQAVMRYRAPGVGTGYRHVRLGQLLPPIRLRAPASVRGRVVEPVGAWSYGWRCAELRPVAGAEVLVMGGGEHGVELAQARSDEHGTFVVDGFDDELDGLGLRVRAPGFAIEHLPLPRTDGAAADVPVVALVRTRPRAGRIVAPPGFDATSLRVLARGLPGVETVPAADGTFVLDHVPPSVSPRLLLYGLPATLAHASARAEPDVRIELVAAAAVRGRVVDATTREPLGGAMVFCGDDHAVRADAHGRFEIGQLPPGPAVVDAKYHYHVRRRLQSRSGSLSVDLRSGETLDDVVVPIE